jgi:hypothetical protein
VQWIRVRRPSLPPPYSTAAMPSAMLTAVHIQRAPWDLRWACKLGNKLEFELEEFREFCTDLRSSLFFVTDLSSFDIIGSELMPSRGIVPWSKKCAADKTVPSPPTATMRSTSAKCCRSNSTLFTHEKLTWCCLNIPNKSLTHCLCAWNLDSSRFHLNALGACPRNFSCSGKKMNQGTGMTSTIRPRPHAMAKNVRT